jgi:hypothetical protein
MFTYEASVDFEGSTLEVATLMQSSSTFVTGREADHSPPTSAEVKKMWIYTSTPPYAFMA